MPGAQKGRHFAGTCVRHASHSSTHRLFTLRSIEPDCTAKEDRSGVIYAARTAWLAGDLPHQLPCLPPSRSRSEGAKKQRTPGITLQASWYYHSMRTISLKLPDDIDARLEARARDLGMTKSEITREA